MKNRLALRISQIAHPISLLVGFLAYSLFFILEPIKAGWTLAGTLLLGILPLIFWNEYHRRTGRYTNFDVSLRKQRYSLYLWMLFLGTVVFGFLWLSDQPRSVLSGGLVLLQLLLVSFLLNFRIKISLHLAIAAYISIALFPINFALGGALIVFLPLIAWSRWQLDRHRVIELVVGAILGLICGFQLLWLSP